jgi:hypothetical protein
MGADGLALIICAVLALMSLVGVLGIGAAFDAGR